jgi:putative nucleotidyltransferase with HDIG domain
MSSPTPKDIISKICEIGSLPQSLASILKVLDDPSADADKIAKVISRDVSLTVRVLKMVNSAQYSRTRKVTKISEAVAVIGLNSIKMLTLSSSVFGMMSDNELMQKCDLKRIWRHLIETAINARNIAEELKYRDPEESFVAGILHDLGIIIMLLYYKDEYIQVIEKLKKQKIGLTKLERVTFGFTHCDIGAEMVEAWKLPPKLVYVIQNHHTIGGPCIVEDDSKLNDIIALADRLTSGPFDEYFPDIEDNIRFIYEIQKKLKLSSESTNKIRKISTRQALTLAEYLELDVGEIMDILAEANERMAELYFSLEKMYVEKQDTITLISEQKCETVI